MKELYNEYLHVPKQGKIREKVMLSRIALTSVVIVICLFAMAFSAYAYFSKGITSGTNVIKVATFETKVEIQPADNSVRSAVTVTTSDNKNFLINGLEVGKYYTVTITHTVNSTAKTGFVVVTADNCPDTYHTQQIAKDVNAVGGQTPSVSFDLMITDPSTVHLLAHWGTSSYYDAYKNNGDQEKLYITHGEDVDLIVNGKAKPVTGQGNDEGTDTEGSELPTDNTNSPTDGTTPDPDSSQSENTDVSDSDDTDASDSPDTESDADQSNELQNVPGAEANADTDTDTDTDTDEGSQPTSEDSNSNE